MNPGSLAITQLLANRTAPLALGANSLASAYRLPSGAEWVQADASFTATHSRINLARPDMACRFVDGTRLCFQEERRKLWMETQGWTGFSLARCT